MRLSIDEHTGSGAAARAMRAPDAAASDPAAPNLSALQDPAALRSFFATIDRVVADNPVDAARLRELARRAAAAPLAAPEMQELGALMAQAQRQGRAVGAVVGYFLTLKPYPMLEEVRTRGKFFQPLFGPVLVVEGNAVRSVLRRDQEFTVEPYGVEMVKAMSPRHNGGFTTFILSTDDTAVYEPDKRLLSAVCNRRDAARLTDLIHRDCMRRIGDAVLAARTSGDATIDVVRSVARYVPITVAHAYLGVPVAAHAASFELTPEMLTYYGDPIDGQPETALQRGDGIVPDEPQLYEWIKAAFQHFFNNVQRDPVVQARGLRACRLLLAHLLREIGIQRARILDEAPVADTMLSRLLLFQMGRSSPTVERPRDLDPRLVSDLRIAENVMGTVVGAVAGQEEATCRVIDSLLRLEAGGYRTSGRPGRRYGSFAEAQALALDVIEGRNPDAARATLYAYVFEALRLEPQGEVLLRKCARDGARIGNSRRLTAGTLIFASHGAAMTDVPDADAFILGRPRAHYLHYGWKRHTCLGQHVSPVIMTETAIALLALQDLRRAPARSDEPSFPFERRTGHLQLDERNLYATTFTLQFADSGTTRRFWPFAVAATVEGT